MQSHIFVPGQRINSSKTHTTPCRHKPAALNFQKKTSRTTFQRQYEQLHSSRLTLVKRRTQPECLAETSGLAIQHLVAAAIMHLEFDCREPVANVNVKQRS